MSHSQGFRDKSGTITVGATSQQLVAENTGRAYLLVQNLDDTEDLWIRIGTTAAVAGAASNIRLRPLGGGIVWEDDTTPSQAIQIIATTTGHKFTCYEG